MRSYDLNSRGREVVEYQWVIKEWVVRSRLYRVGIDRSREGPDVMMGGMGSKVEVWFTLQ